jgi:hypothetical protein
LLSQLPREIYNSCVTKITETSTYERKIAIDPLFALAATGATAQDDEAYLKANAVRIDNPEKLSDSVYNLLSPYQVITVGEMHGTNESAPFVNGLTNLFTSKGDSVMVGFEIPPILMTKFSSLHTDSSIYQSDFFSNPPFLDGKESKPWANLLSTLNRNPKFNSFSLMLTPEKINYTTG